MKLKGIPVIEQQADKIAVGITAAAAVGVLAMTFLTQPNAVKIDTEPVPPAEAFAKAESEAAKVLGRLDSTALDTPEVPAFTLASKFDRAFKAEPQSRSRVALGNSSTLKIESARPVASESFQSLQVPAPALAAAAAYQGTISPIEVVRVEGLKDMLPSEQPFDKAYVSVQGNFDGVALRELLAADPDGDGPLVPIPLGWWRDPQNQGNDLVNIVAVEVERQTVSLADGSKPGESVIVGSMPGRPSLLKEWSEITRAGDVGPLLDEAFVLSEWVQRPAFYETIAGPRWAPPAELVKVDDEGEDNSRRLEVEQRRLAKLDQEIIQLRQDAERAPSAQELRQRQAERDAEGRGGGGPQGGQRGGKGGGGERNRPPADAGRGERELSKEAIERQLKNKETERARAAKRITELGGKPPELAQAQADPGTPQVAPRVSLLESPEVKLWAHDLTPSRGGVYKYRMRVVLNNPYFGRPLNPDQESLGRDPLVRSAWSEWSEDVEVLPAEYFFITSAEEESQLTPRPRATVEMFQYYYGYYRKATVSLEPGDMIMGEAKLPDGLKFADMSKLPDLLETLPDNPVAPPAPARVPGRGPDGGGPQNVPPSVREGQRGRAPGLAPGDRVPGDRVPADRIPSDPSQDSGSPILTLDAPEERVLKVDAVFLDAAKTAVTGPTNTGGAARYVALFRDLAGRIVTRSPEQDRSQRIYKQIDASARQGANQGKVEVQNPTPEPPRPPRDERNRYRPPAPGGGGGGGGGGG